MPDFTFCGCTLIQHPRMLVCSGGRVDITATEDRILRYMATMISLPISKESLASHALGVETTRNIRVQTTITFLRRKIADIKAPFMIFNKGESSYVLVSTRPNLVNTFIPDPVQPTVKNYTPHRPDPKDKGKPFSMAAMKLPDPMMTAKIAQRRKQSLGRI